MSVRKPQMSSVCSFVRLHDRHFKAVHFIRNVYQNILFSNSIQFIFIHTFTKYLHYTVYIVRWEYTNKEKEKEEEEGKKKLMAWIEVYGGQRSLTLELTTAIL